MTNSRKKKKKIIIKFTVVLQDSKEKNHNKIQVDCGSAGFKCLPSETKTKKKLLHQDSGPTYIYIDVYIYIYLCLPADASNMKEPKRGHWIKSRDGLFLETMLSLNCNYI